MLRQVVELVPSLPQMGGRIRRVIGSTDARGQGTPFAIADVGPFVLFGVADGLQGPELPPFGVHPHAGLVAVSYVPTGGPWRSKSNVPGQEHLPLDQGEVLVTLSGRGIAHDEVTVGDGAHALVQIILRQPASHRDVPAALWGVRPVAIADGVWRLFDRGVLKRAGVDATCYHVRLPPRGVLDLPVDSGHRSGFAFAHRGAVSVSGRRLEEHSVAVLGPVGDGLRLEAEEAPVDCIVGFAAPHEEPWAKLLGANGFVIARDDAGAQAKLAEYGRDPERFGQA